ncbi:hypothetical protein CP532_4668 [Ophiocordyceps camponoti-leonardi (nom. inval.)]|nr:hypothetical protein CP532_4668 [Ophiocordyceps camponoti-leonardi (nom. inval.)]
MTTPITTPMTTPVTTPVTTPKETTSSSPQQTPLQIPRPISKPIGEETAALRARNWLHRRSETLYSECDDGTVIRDNFSQLLILETLSDPSLIRLRYPTQSSTWNYFQGTPCKTTREYPDDVDVTSYAHRLLPHDSSTTHNLLDKMLTPEMTSPEGIIQVYFSPSRNRLDPAVCINALRLYAHHDRYETPSLSATKTYVLETLLQRRYLSGTRYYPSPDVFLYFLAHLVRHIPLGRPLLRGPLAERFHRPADALSLAMRLEACRLVGVEPPAAERKRLLAMQRPDGSFDPGWLCKFGRSAVRIGNRGLTTALAVRAIEAAAAGMSDDHKPALL